MDLRAWVSGAAKLMEALGVFTMVLGAVVAMAVASRRFQTSGSWSGFRMLRQVLGRAILLGLEFLVAADIIRTVSEVPTLTRVAILGMIVLIRTFLSFTLEVELEGRWPWQQSAMDRDEAKARSAG